VKWLKYKVLLAADEHSLNTRENDSFCKADFWILIFIFWGGFIIKYCLKAFLANEMFNQESVNHERVFQSK